MAPLNTARIWSMCTTTIGGQVMVALEAGGAVQDVPYARLKERLLRDGQILHAPAGGNEKPKGKP